MKNETLWHWPWMICVERTNGLTRQRSVCTPGDLPFSQHVAAFVWQVQQFLKEMLRGQAPEQEGLAMPVVIEEDATQRFT